MFYSKSNYELIDLNYVMYILLKNDFEHFDKLWISFKKESLLVLLSSSLLKKLSPLSFPYYDD